MKKNFLKLLVAISTLSLVACGQTEQTSQVNQETSSSTQKVTESSSTTKSEKVTPADYSPLPDDLVVEENVKKALQAYVGVYQITQKQEVDGRIWEVKFEIEITKDGYYTAYTESQQIDEIQNGGGTLYVNDKGEFDIIRKTARLSSGVATMSYGQLELSEPRRLYQQYVDENGEILPYFTTGGSKYVEIPHSKVMLVDGTVKYGDSEHPENAVILEKKNKASSAIQYTYYQIKQYSDSINSDKESYEFESFNEFVQAMRLDSSDISYLQKSYKIVDPNSLTGYYTEDNQEITNIKYAYVLQRENEKEVYFVYDGQGIYELRVNEKGQKVARTSYTSERIRDFVEYKIR
ncbi:TPA: hypothetical protein ACGO43_000155 [Streptococcus suis]|uniref:Putative lipoprotein n=1 Tax=Streptococcus suis TaxID=1307 RepID=A0A0Z8XY58_STRSU|nr:hypothetical protein [Streptococcus suis]NQR97088.1 hypothetical protein [Streptococcus suis]CYY00868.1 putative lipoprotein [Streptococcus suis]